jgi:hypothetical protein
MEAAFNTPFGLCEPTVMFFGLCNSPATFQRMMNHILWEEISEGWCKVYMDDILITALQEWRIYLEGAPHRITVYTDHKNLQYFRTAQKLHPRLSRYSLLLSQFDLHLVHKPGKTMTLSDPLC